MTRRDFIKGMAITGAAAGATVLGGGILFLNTPQFGRKPRKERLERMMASPNWKNGAFCNYETLSRSRAPIEKRQSRFKVMWNFLFGDKRHLMPREPLEMVKPDFRKKDSGEDFAIWLGHSSVFISIAGYRILVDPVFSPYASPVPFINRAFDGPMPCKKEEIPEIDLLLISHDHWDHLDAPTLRAIKDRVKKCVTMLGVGEYLEYWGYEEEKIAEGDWWDEIEPLEGLKTTILPSRHFSGRLRRPNQTLWGGFLIECGGRKVLFSGDGGWGRHVHEIAKKAEGCDLAFLENGQYNIKWPSCHMAPEETLRYALALDAKAVVPIHNSRFVLSEHNWNEPLLELTRLAEGTRAKIITPRMGEEIAIGDGEKKYKKWFLQVKYSSPPATATTTNH